MRVAMLTWESLHSVVVGGIASHVTELAASLRRLGHEVHVFTRRRPGQSGHDWIDGVHYHRCAYPGHSDFVEDVNNMCRAFVDHVFDVEDLVGHFDVVHAHDWLTANAMIWIKQGRGHKCVLTIHSTEYARCGNSFPGGRSQRIRAQERAGTYWADRILAVSHATKSEIMWMYEAPEWKIAVGYNGVNPHRFDIELDPGGIKRRYQIGPVNPTVLFCGRLTWHKGPDLLLAAVPSILKFYGNAKFVFAGEGEMRGELEARARHMGVADAVRFVGFRNGGELVDLFKMADVVCVPSRNEPFGIVVLEGWSARKPVVVSQNGGPNEYVSHEFNGLKIHPAPDSVAWGLGTIFADFDWGRWMGENGRRTVDEQFTWDKVSRSVLAVYFQALGWPAAPEQDRAGSVEAPAAPAKPAEAPVELAAQPPEPQSLKEDDKPACPLQAAAVLTLTSKSYAPFVSEALSECQRVLREAGLAAQIEANKASFEGPWDDVVAAIARCGRLLQQNGNGRSNFTVRLFAAGGDPAVARESEEIERLKWISAGSRGPRRARKPMRARQNRPMTVIESGTATAAASSPGQGSGDGSR